LFKEIQSLYESIKPYQDIASIMLNEQNNIMSLSIRDNAKVGIPILITQHDDEFLYVQLGEANHFDVPITNGSDEYILNIVKSCIENGVQEAVTRKKDKIVKSTLILTIGGKKEIVAFKPYK